jgi:hypothetical protein
MSFLINYFEHLRSFTFAATALGAVGEFKLGTMDAVVRAGTHRVEFLAQYLVRNSDGTLTYSMQFQENAEGFIGWLPYFNKRWLEAYDKLAFKKRCNDLKLPTPAWSVGRIAPELGDFVVKSARGSSFGQRMRGPFAAAEANSHELRNGEYADEFVPGQIGKAWFWNDRVVAIGLREPASVTGDGTSSLAELVRRVRWSADVVRVSDFFRYRRLDWAQVPVCGETVVLDYKYGSPYERYEYASTNRIEELDGTPLVDQLNAWGPMFWDFVPLNIREGTLYTVDFVLSDSAGIRLLEMNCNPMVPPEIYGIILKAALNSAVAGTGSVPMRTGSMAGVPAPVAGTVPGLAPLMNTVAGAVPQAH